MYGKNTCRIHGPGGTVCSIYFCHIWSGGTNRRGDRLSCDRLSCDRSTSLTTISGSKDQMLKLPDLSDTLGVARPKLAILLFLSDLKRCTDHKSEGVR